MADTILRDLWRDPLPADIEAGITAEKLVLMIRDIMRTDLNEHEKGTRQQGGHTLRDHVGKTRPEMIQRLLDAERLYETSTFYHGQEFAETVVAKAILSDLHRVYNWYYKIDNPPGGVIARAGGKKDFILIKVESNFPVGTQVKLLNDGTFEEAICSHVFVKIIRGNIAGRNKYIVTSFPCIPRPEAS
ncbi:RNase A-like domain-containing protein [Nissabacter sp. SGAir0207]|uniref:RNase A-like domain-containing protein n=1 Tax=Nissabacter sp. SGAir0207 TaxID=2126321 RepID=UPI0010F68834|nr:RNase A-like domain-containing protein [Nissabacter sp. SGAir0207]